MDVWLVYVVLKNWGLEDGVGPRLSGVDKIALLLLLGYCLKQ